MGNFLLCAIRGSFYFALTAAQPQWSVGLDRGDHTSRYAIVDEDGELIGEGECAGSNRNPHCIEPHSKRLIKNAHGSRLGPLSRFSLTHTSRLLEVTRERR